MKEQPKRYPCPQCGQKIAWLTSNVWRPFCSKGCRLIDLGKWANDEYSVPAENGDSQDINYQEE